MKVMVVVISGGGVVVVVMSGLQLMLVFNGGEKITTKLEKKITKSMAKSEQSTLTGHRLLAGRAQSSGQ